MSLKVDLIDSTEEGVQQMLRSRMKVEWPISRVLGGLGSDIVLHHLAGNKGSVGYQRPIADKIASGMATHSYPRPSPTFLLVPQ